MKRILVVLSMMVMLVACSAQIAAAEKVKWQAPDFKFGAVTAVEVESINMHQPTYDNFVTENGAESKVEIALMEAFAKEKVQFTAPIEGETVSSTTVDPSKALKIIVNVYALGSQWEWQEPYTETRHVTRQTYVVDDKGHVTKVSIPDTETVNHPRKKIYTARAEIEFVVKTADGSRVVYTINDSRDNYDTTDTSGMLKRITHEFAEAITED